MKLRLKTEDELLKVCNKGEYAYFLKGKDSVYHFPISWRKFMGKWFNVYSSYIDDDGESVYEGDFPENPLPAWFFSPYKIKLEIE